MPPKASNDDSQKKKKRRNRWNKPFPNRSESRSRDVAAMTSPSSLSEYAPTPKRQRRMDSPSDDETSSAGLAGPSSAPDRVLRSRNRGQGEEREVVMEEPDQEMEVDSNKGKQREVPMEEYEEQEDTTRKREKVYLKRWKLSPSQILLESSEDNVARTQATTHWHAKYGHFCGTFRKYFAGPDDHRSNWPDPRFEGPNGIIEDDALSSWYSSRHYNGHRNSRGLLPGHQLFEDETLEDREEE
ncbi:hypothetical protein FA15DRAFT_711566 [Coprinopsis marcescibilis]|uniref:Uncharacterized protein n=1 Tax=Coprinopsis marcescibilis TaxID=230819 RepID=A0A5C3KA96_COPMA|nr:hypothetical protein FA15DRAFT_711566 [Coprinopsis marcescibilis]